jgi:alpha-ketoglutarate-dependent taurine dioxygenase
MVPTSETTAAVFEMFASRLAESSALPFHWNADDMLVIDNWQVLHGRGVGEAAASEDRELVRVTIQ